MPSVDLNFPSVFEDVISWDITTAAAAGVGQTVTYLSKCFNAIYEVVDVAFLSAVAIAADATNNVTVAVNKYDGIGGAGVAVATYTSDVAGGGVVAGVPKQLIVTPTLVNRQLSPPNLLGLVITKGGTGVVIGPGRFVITLRLRDA
jgi:hypothetical protein